MSDTNKATAKVGDLVDLTEDPAEVTGPDGHAFTVVGGRYFIDRPGVHVVNGVAVTAK